MPAGIAAEYLMEPGRYMICEVSESFHWRGRPSRILAERESEEAIRRVFDNMTGDNLPLGPDEDGMIIGIFDRVKREWI